MANNKIYCNDICQKIWNGDVQKQKTKRAKTRCDKCQGISKVIDTRYLNLQQIQRTLRCTECNYKYKKNYNVDELHQRKKIVPKKCQNCNEYFVKEKQHATDKAICCSRKCMKELWQKTKYKRYERKCLNCDEIFSKRRQIYCSRKCQHESMVKNRAWQPSGNYIYNCVVCEKDFAVDRAQRSVRKTCSPGCKHISSKGLPKKLWKKFKDKNYRNKYSHLNKLLKVYTRRNESRFKHDTSLTVEYLMSILPTNDKCPVLEYDLFYKSTKRPENRLTLDRINNKKGYIKGNVMWMSLKANLFKNNLTEGELVKFSKFWLNYLNNEALQGLSDTNKQG